MWIVLNEDLTFACFRWYGNAPGQPLPSLEGFTRAKHARANAQGFKKERAQTWRVPKSAFGTVPDMAGLVEELFGWV